MVSVVLIALAKLVKAGSQVPGKVAAAGVVVTALPAVGQALRGRNQAAVEAMRLRVNVRMYV